MSGRLSANPSLSLAELFGPVIAQQTSLQSQSLAGPASKFGSASGIQGEALGKSNRPEGPATLRTLNPQESLIQLRVPQKFAGVASKFGSASGIQWAAPGKPSRPQGPAVQPNVQQKPAYRGHVSGPVRIVLSIFQRWHLSDNDAAVLLGVDHPQFIADLRVGTSGLVVKDMKDRVALLVRIYEGVHALLRERDAEVRWINSKLPSLDDHSLLELMLRGSFADLAYIRNFVDYANGR